VSLADSEEVTLPAFHAARCAAARLPVADTPLVLVGGSYS